MAATVVMVVVAATALGVSGAGAEDPPPDAMLMPSATEGGPGTTLTVAVSGCDAEEHDSFRHAVLRLATTGATPAVVAVGDSYLGQDAVMTLPDWYEPGPGLLTADCVEENYGNDAPSVLFSYPPVAFDLQAGTGPVRQTMALSRTSVDEGQVIDVMLTGCDQVEGEPTIGYAQLIEGDDIGLGLNQARSSANGVPDEDGNVHIELAALAYYDPLDPGPYTVVGICLRGDAVTLYPTAPVTVTATNPSVDSLMLERHVADAEVMISGAGCTGGALVTLDIETYRWDGPLQAERSFSKRVEKTAAAEQAARDVDRQVVTPAEDGSWSYLWPEPENGADDLQVVADCGDPAAAGFRYRPQYLYLGIGDLAWVQRVSPTRSPEGGPVDVHLYGSCPDEVTVELLDGEGEVHSTGSATLTDWSGKATLEAPDHAGQYVMRLQCGHVKGYGASLDVFDPGPPVSPDPVPPGPPATGWPSAGPVEHYTGRIGPIMLPAGDMHPMAEALPPSGLGVALPRPEGDFAIRSMKYDLVDAESNASVSREDAHLHHFVMARLNDHNPACPNGTFGLPGNIFAAVGQERTELNLADPYGLVVKADDAWAGVYDLMNLTDEAREVYLTYEMTYQRDISKIRPLNTYFTSATGCSSFTWTINGNGEKDVQRTYIDVESDGLLVGGGGHVHSGGEATELYDDRDRLLCRAEAHFGEGHGGHGGHEMAASADTGTPTTMMDGPPEYPPEFYPDDPPLEHISNCGGINRPVKAGERLRFDAIYTNDRARSGVMGIALFHVWEGGGPADPVTGPVDPPGSVPPGGNPPAGQPGNVPPAPAAKPLSGKARFTG